ncbi:hypothetical protein ACFXKW_38510 [Streptomyces sp. NPDC059193]|uniref:hypothetical protein n=1 Tax=Streptomyces sp. NPDC059193 TaxID=3346763 RepID=UPI0036972F43
MRPEVQAFVADGPLPDRDASEEKIDRRDQQLRQIVGPIIGEGAQAFVSCFGPDDCYGVAWSLLHLIETCPNPVPAGLPAPGNEWHQRLYDRANLHG